MAKEKILIIDDEDYIRKLIRKSLIHENYQLEEASSGQSALEILKSNTFDMIILDVMLEDYDGFELIKEIKKLGIKSSIFFVSGRCEDYDKILGLGLGADNYITKPFSPAVLCAHVKAQLRIHRDYVKISAVPSNLIIRNIFKFDLKTYKFYKEENLIDLSYKENLLMKLFMENPQQVFTKEQIYENVWHDTIIDDNAIMVYISNLRKKIENKPKSPKHIVTVWGIGYKFVP
jgi:DNA-binding response OmpR family regulator